MNEQGNSVKHKAMPRSEEELRQLQNRLSRITGQLNGIGRMLEENRYCGDVLMQVAAVEKALQALGYMILQSHMETCMVEEIEKGNTEVIDEVVGLIKNLK
ncbi:MAG TPA: metal-sensing transcriptional repressor [Candidatus Copromorpha excrementigallinarum]|uniref:Metal-sensing transcriptional repressor n=1 Tax=Candidatus Allocopromorpha excrementigallinarum TaxID=2840742 RepID=A0A9D1HZ96_9FIRM|nr:metal-sensing transcriptional repressor [Candidatus Copromorpha excrementigallinarum]